MGEESVLLDSPLDKVDPYQLFSATLMSKFVHIAVADTYGEMNHRPLTLC